MSRRKDRPALVPDDDPVRWFVRFERALREEDYPLAAIARDRLHDLGWKVEPAKDRPTPRQVARGERGEA
jgi:hypothetical protein